MRTYDPDKAREYRNKRKEQGKPLSNNPNRKSGPSGKSKRKFDRGEFIAWDGEGMDTGRCGTGKDMRDGHGSCPTEHQIGEWVDEFTPFHVMTLFANSLGESIAPLEGRNRVGTVQCFELLLSTAAQHRNAIHVIYAGSYDVNHILRDIGRDTITELGNTNETKWNGYYIKYIPRKYLFLSDGKRAITLWDVIGFFQSSFVNTLEKWLGTDYPDLGLIKTGKKERENFATTDPDFIQRYNNAELSALVHLCKLLQLSVSSANLKLNRWDGAGAVAAAFYRKHQTKQHIRPLTQEGELAARHAYFGGRIECAQFGVTHDTVYAYDINSAYPNEMLFLPSLVSGEWVHRTNPSFSDLRNPFAVCHVRWDLPHTRFCPFPYRYPRGSVAFPQRGENWVWYPEVAAWFQTGQHGPTIANRTDPRTVEILESWEWIPDEPIYPFQWVREYYEWRQRIVQGLENVPTGLEKVIKLGLNSLYGKLAQSTGYQPEKNLTPPYHCLAWAGYITSGSRAKLYSAASSSPDTVVMMMTDGIISTKPLPLDISTTKELGKWEASEHPGVISVQSGIYAKPDGDGWSVQSRGIDKTMLKDMDLPNRVISAWGNKKSCKEPLPITVSRLVTMKPATKSDHAWRRWGCWTTGEREVTLEPENTTKRVRDKKWSNQYPGKGLVGTLPSLNEEWDIKNNPVISAPYERPWDRDGWEVDSMELLDDDREAIWESGTE